MRPPQSATSFIQQLARLHPKRGGDLAQRVQVLALPIAALPLGPSCKSRDRLPAES